MRFVRLWSESTSGLPCLIISRTIVRHSARPTARRVGLADFGRRCRIAVRHSRSPSACCWPVCRRGQAYSGGKVLTQNPADPRTRCRRRNVASSRDVPLPGVAR